MKRSLVMALAAAAMYAMPAQAAPVVVCPATGNANFSYEVETSPNGPAWFNRFGRFLCDAPADQYNLGTMPSNSFEVFCIDYVGSISPGAVYDVWLTEVSLAGVAASTNERLNNVANDWERYWRAVWLIDRYFTLGGTAGGDANAYQWAIWGTTDNTNIYDSQAGGAAGTLRALAAAQNPGSDPTRFSDWRIITSTIQGCNQQVNSNACLQELVYKSGSSTLEIVPEPATMTLLAMGLAGMAGAGVRRRKQK